MAVGSMTTAPWARSSLATVLLPLAMPPVRPMMRGTPRPAAAPPASGHAPQAQPLCVAVQDDDADVRDGLIAVLE